MVSPKVKTIIFVTASLTVFLISGAFYVWLGIGPVSPAVSVPAHADRTYLNQDFRQDDPLVTKNPSLRQMLAGPIISATDPGRGSLDAPVTAVIFGDYSCEYCHEQERHLFELYDRHPGQIRLIWKDYPENDPVGEPYRAAMAARCAAEQGKFWEYHDGLFADNQALGDELYQALADEILADRAAFERCLKDDDTRQAVADNIEEAEALDLPGIPFVYINAQEVMGRFDIEDLENIVKIELSN